MIQHTIASAAELFGSSVDTGLLAGLKTAAQEGDSEMVENISSQIRDHADQIQEVCGGVDMRGVLMLQIITSVFWEPGGL